MGLLQLIEYLIFDSPEPLDPDQGLPTIHSLFSILLGLQLRQDQCQYLSLERLDRHAKVDKVGHQAEIGAKVRALVHRCDIHLEAGINVGDRAVHHD